MAGKIIEYKMHRNVTGNLIKPYFIEDGGYFGDTDNQFIGVVSDSTEFYVPKTSKDDASSDLVEFTRAELITRMQTNGIKDEEGNDLTSEQIATQINSWCDARNVPS